MPDWVSDLEIAISNQAPNWLVTNLNWLPDAYQLDPGVARDRGKLVGSDYGRGLRQGSWQRVHLSPKAPAQQ